MDKRVGQLSNRRVTTNTTDRRMKAVAAETHLSEAASSRASLTRLAGRQECRLMNGSRVPGHLCVTHSSL